MTTLLEIKHLTMRFGGLLAIDDVSFTALKGQITAVIGPNGAGKTTLFNCLTGFYRPSGGKLTLHRPAPQKPLSLEHLAGHQIIRAGVARTFQNIRLFAGMTVLENLLVAQHQALSAKAGIFGGLRYRTAEKAAITTALTWLEAAGLADKANFLAGSLPYGEQRKLEIARALCLNPLLLCLDEPAAGLNPSESDALSTFLLHLRKDYGLSLLLIEHDMGVVMGVADKIVVLEYGRKIAIGTPSEIQQNPEVIRAYLGEEEAA